MATRGQTHNKRAREMALREKRERKQAKKDDRAAGLLPVYDDEGNLIEPSPEASADGDVEVEGEAPADEQTEVGQIGEVEQVEKVGEAIQ